MYEFNLIQQLTLAIIGFRKVIINIFQSIPTKIAYAASNTCAKD